jgi:hypothetical protein
MGNVLTVITKSTAIFPCLCKEEKRSGKREEEGRTQNFLNMWLLPFVQFVTSTSMPLVIAKNDSDLVEWPAAQNL